MELMHYRFNESGSLSPVCGGFWASVKGILKLLFSNFLEIGGACVMYGRYERFVQVCGGET
jgi:hypothetical protein